jgi:O-antigen ligase
MQDLREVYGDDPSYAWLVLDAKDAHNLYLDTLVQGGITAFLGLVTVLVVWFRYLHSTRFSADMDDLDWMLWTTSAAMLMITLAGGMTNRLLRGEPALLIALLLGIWIAYSYRKTRDASSQNSLCE